MKNEILDNMESLPDAGALMYKDVRYILIRPETLIEFQKTLEADLSVEKVGQALYSGGHRGGSLSATRFRQEFSYTPEEIVHFMAKMGGQIGWGRMEITALDLKRGTLEIEVHHSAFAEAYQQAKTPVCHMIRGVFAGTWEGAIERQVNGLETRCRAVDGPGACKFIFTASGGSNDNAKP